MAGPSMKPNEATAKNRGTVSQTGPRGVSARASSASEAMRSQVTPMVTMRRGSTRCSSRDDRALLATRPSALSANSRPYGTAPTPMTVWYRNGEAEM